MRAKWDDTTRPVKQCGFANANRTGGPRSDSTSYLYTIIEGRGVQAKQLWIQNSREDCEITGGKTRGFSVFHLKYFLTSVIGVLHFGHGMSDMLRPIPTFLLASATMQDLQ